MHFLIKFDQDWADELQCQQFRIVELDCKSASKGIKKIKKAVQAMLDEELLMYFGTNEFYEPNELTVDSFDIDFISSITADVLESQLGSTFGTGILRHIDI